MCGCVGVSMRCVGVGGGVGVGGMGGMGVVYEQGGLSMRVQCAMQVVNVYVPASISNSNTPKAHQSTAMV